MIRPFNSSDMEHVLNIWLDASIKAHDFIKKEYWESKISDMRDIYLPLSETIVYDIKGTILGFASLNENTLAAIFVSPTMQGQGIGKLLMEKVKKMRKELNLTVYKKNISSIEFYKKCGFVKLKEQTDKYTGHQEFVMVYKK